MSTVDGGIYLGFPAESLQGEAPPQRRPLRYTEGRHLCLIGPTGAGKTKRLLVPALHDLTGWSTLVVDVKGELCAMTREHRARSGSEIITLNPFDVLGLGSSRFNPIASLELTEEFPDDALELAEAIVRIEGKEPHWSQAAQEIVAALIMYVRLVIPDGSFSDVRSLLSMNDKKIRTLVSSPGCEIDGEDYYFNYKGLKLPGMIAAGILYGWEEIGNKAERFGDISPENRELHGVLATALTQTRWLDSRPVKRDLAGPTFDFATIRDKPVTIYLVLPARRLVTHSSWLRLIITAVIQKLMRDVKSRKVPVLLMLDEYYALAQGDGFPVVKRNMALFRGYGVKLWTIWQDSSQAEELYGKAFESFLSNAGVIQVFAPQDVTTAEYFSKLSGQRTRRVLAESELRSPNYGAPSGAHITQGLNEFYIPLPLLLPQDLRHAEDGYSVVFTHVAKGPVRVFSPYPTEIRHLRAICALDPANA